MLRVGLTGNIGSGKSTASHILAKLGARVIDADSIVHELLVPESPTHRAIADAFGKSILKPDGTIDRKRLGTIVFGNRKDLALLNSLVHPAVRREIFRRIEELEKSGFAGMVVVDAALMVETGLYRELDKLIVITCPPDIQVQRIVRRDGTSAEDARSRMESQLPADQKVKIADFEVDNSNSIDATREQLARIYRILMEGIPERDKL